MSFKEELEEIKKLLSQNCSLKKDEFRIFYDSLMVDLQKKYPKELAAFWEAKYKMVPISKSTIRYMLKEIL